MVFYFHNCSIPLNQVYLPLCIHRGGQVLTSVMSQCTHIIVFNADNSTDLPTEVISFPQIRVVRESWLEECFRQNRCVDDTPFLLQPVDTNCQFSSLRSCVASVSYFMPTMNYMVEWQSDIEASVNRLFEGLSDYESIFQGKNHLFLPTIDKCAHIASFIL